MDQVVKTTTQEKFIEDGFLHLVYRDGRRTAKETRAKAMELTRRDERVAVTASTILDNPDLNDLLLRLEGSDK